MAPQRDWIEKDFYAVLGVSSSASDDEIKKAYRQLARENHPDANADNAAAADRFKEISEAFSVLKDNEKKREYDEVRRLASSGAFAGGLGGRGGAGQTFQGGDLGDLFSNLFGGGAGNVTFGGGGGGGRRARRPEKGADVRASLHLTFEDALAGVQTKLRIRGKGTCTTCRGTGAKPGTTPHTCGTCNGSGNVAIDQGPFSMSQPCPHCGGNGTIIDDPCPTCDGAGTAATVREINVKIPAGVRDGAVVRVGGRGQPGRNGGPAGDLLVEVEVEPHRLFGRRGDDLTLDIPLTFAEATLGTKLKVPTLVDGFTTIRIPAGTTPGRTFRIRGKGAPMKNGTSGDLLVSVQVEVPDKLSREQKKLVEQLAALDDTTARDAHLQVV